MNINEKLVKVISPDPFTGPFESEDYIIEENGTISVLDNSVTMAGKICYKVNRSNKFDYKLVRFGSSGDVIVLGFDKVGNKEPVFESKLGRRKNISVEIREHDNIFYIYIDGQRRSKTFEKLSTAKGYCTRVCNNIDQLSQVKGYDFVNLD